MVVDEAYLRALAKAVVNSLAKKVPEPGQEDGHWAVPGNDSQ
jgi:hypothetical protein